MASWVEKLHKWTQTSKVGASKAGVPAEATDGLDDPSFATGRIYAIGDLHGCLTLLDRMHAAIRQDLATKPPASARIVYVGDYCDRGPDTAGVLGRLAQPPDDLPPATLLKGNHEDILLAFLDEPEVLRSWRQLGGLQTLSSYGIDRRLAEHGRDLREARDALIAAMPQAHVALLRSLPTSLLLPPFFFCHAGVRPGIAIDAQDERDLLWIRAEFLNSSADHGARVVHGHTPAEHVEVLTNRINVDTGAYATGRLSCAVLDGAAVRIIEARL